MVQAPLIIYGTITESGSGVDTITVKARNESTNQTLTATTNSSGRYILDAAAFTDGYQDTDIITVYTIYQNFEGQESITVALPIYLYEQDITLSAVSDSESIDYCTVQDVYDELDDKTSTDIAATKVIKAIQRAEALVDLKTGTSFKINTETDEVHSMNRYNADVSPERLDLGYNWPQRSDRWGWINNRVKVSKTPLISVSSLSKNDASAVNSDSWTALSEQSGSGGDFIIMNKDAGIIDFVNNYPSFGERAWKITYTWGHDPDSTDRDIIARLRVAQRLTILIATRTVLSRKSSGAVFDSTRDIKIGTIEIKGAGQSTSTHIRDIKEEETGLWNALGDLGIEVI